MEWQCVDVDREWRGAERDGKRRGAEGDGKWRGVEWGVMENVMAPSWKRGGGREWNGDGALDRKRRHGMGQKMQWPPCGNERATGDRKAHREQNARQGTERATGNGTCDREQNA